MNHQRYVVSNTVPGVPGDDSTHFTPFANRGDIDIEEYCCYWVIVLLVSEKKPNLIQNQSVVLTMVTLVDDSEETVPTTPRVAFVPPGYYYWKHCLHAIAVAGVTPLIAHAVAVLFTTCPIVCSKVSRDFDLPCRL